MKPVLGLFRILAIFVLALFGAGLWGLVWPARGEGWVFGLLGFAVICLALVASILRSLSRLAR